jgi:hypothetical protein
METDDEGTNNNDTRNSSNNNNGDDAMEQDAANDSSDNEREPEVSMAQGVPLLTSTPVCEVHLMHSLLTTSNPHLGIRCPLNATPTHQYSGM